MLSSLLSACLLAGSAHAADAEGDSFGAADRVVVFVLDGVRAVDLFESAKDGSPARMAALIERGVLMTGLRNLGPTSTEPAHRTMFTGQYQPHTNLPWYETRTLQRAFSPTMWEALYAETGQRGAIGGNTVFMDSQASSLYPGHPGRWQSDELVLPEWTEESDEFIFERMAEHLEEDYALYVVNVHESDKQAHVYHWDEYLSNLDEGLALVEAWVDSQMRDGDTVILVADHGRHLDDYAQHGDACSGCRESWIVAFGEGIRTDRPAFVGQHELTDVGPTVAWLLGAHMPTARGRLIRGLLADPPTLPVTADARVDPWVAVTADGVLHRVADQDPARWGLRTGPLVYQRSEDEGETWTTVFFGEEARYSAQREPRLVAAGATVVRTWKALDSKSLVWDVMAQVSTDGGATWGDTQLVADGVAHNQDPVLALDLGGNLRFFGSNQAEGDTDAATGWWTVSGNIASGWAASELTPPMTSGDREIHTPASFDAVMSDGTWTQVFIGILDEDYVDNNHNREVILARQPARSVDMVRVTDDELIAWHPTMTVDDAGVTHIAWVVFDDTVEGAERWRLQTRRTPDAGDTWTEIQDIELDGEPWRPRLVSTEAGVYLAWIEVDGEDHAVRIATFDEGALGEPLTLAEVEGTLESLVATATPTGELVLSWHQGISSLQHRLSGAIVDGDLGSFQPF